MVVHANSMEKITISFVIEKKGGIKTASLFANLPVVNQNSKTKIVTKKIQYDR